MDGSTLVEKSDLELPQFFPDSEDVSTQIDSSLSGEKKEVAEVALKDKMADAVLQGAEITDDTMKDVNGQNKEEITDKTSDHKNGEKKNVEPATDVKADENVKATEMEIERNDVSADNESGTVQANANGEQEVPSEAATPTGNYDISVKSPTIHDNDSDDSKDNDEPLSLSEIPTSQLDTSVGNSSEQENEDVDERSEGNTMVDEGKDIEDTPSKSKKNKRLGTTGPVKNVKSKKPKKSPKKGHNSGRRRKAVKKKNS